MTVRECRRHVITKTIERKTKKEKLIERMKETKTQAPTISYC